MHHYLFEVSRVKDTSFGAKPGWFYEISLDKQKGYGCFEHSAFGEEQGGGLWFENGELVDFDGVSFLPSCIADFLRAQGYGVDPDMEES